MVFGWYRKMQDWLQKKERNQRRSPHLQSFGRRRRRLSEICPTTCLWDSIKDDPGELHFEGPGRSKMGETLVSSCSGPRVSKGNSMMVSPWLPRSSPIPWWRMLDNPWFCQWYLLVLVATWKKTPQKSQVMYFKTFLCDWLLIMILIPINFFFLQALIGTLSMTDSGGFPPGTPVSTHLLKYYIKERKKELKRE